MSKLLISFDLDDTLICYSGQTPREPERVPWVLRRWLGEPLRAGTLELMQALSRDGWTIAVYTTSGRSERRIRNWLRWYGVRPALVVNQSRHVRALCDAGIVHGPTKLPSLFGVDLHVDDSVGVALEGRRFGFRVLVVRPDDPNWSRAVLQAARRVADALQVVHPSDGGGANAHEAFYRALLPAHSAHRRIDVPAGRRWPKAG